MAKETLRGGAAEQEIRDALDSRLFALARSHDILASEGWEGASLEEVISRALASFITSGNLEERIVVEGQKVRLSPPCTVSLGLDFMSLRPMRQSMGRCPFRMARSRCAGLRSLRKTEEAHG
ncbi:HWE histidine kinase domain-containing protein [Sinorhizobium meliloti]|uniref:HWE histidine kinase domain-containing protein n=1 Tax=Rhizobium meliloti TaxID=382 RepID=UPI00398C86B4